MARLKFAPKSTPFRGPIPKPHYLPHPWTHPTYDAKRHPDPICHFATMHWTDRPTDRRTSVRTDRPTDRPRECLTSIGRCAPRATRPNNNNNSNNNDSARRYTHHTIAIAILSVCVSVTLMMHARQNGSIPGISKCAVLYITQCSDISGFYRPNFAVQSSGVHLERGGWIEAPLSIAIVWPVRRDNWEKVQQDIR